MEPTPKRGCIEVSSVVQGATLLGATFVENLAVFVKESLRCRMYLRGNFVFGEVGQVPRVPLSEALDSLDSGYRAQRASP